MTTEGLPQWPRAGVEPLCPAVIRMEPKDFLVSEILDIEFDGEGEHDWLWIEKEATNTEWLARQLARFTGVVARDVGYAGMKDRNAITRQWFSVRRVSGAGYDWSAFELPGVRVLEIVRHSRKLRRGAHRGNRFELTLKDVQGDAVPALQRIVTQGMPNYFGEQRFGRDGSNIELARALFAGRRLRRDKRSIALSAARSLLFNEILAARINDGSWNSLLPGDYANLAGTGSHFRVEQVDETLARRCRDFDLHPCGPLWGRGAGDAAAPQIERDVAAHYPELSSGLEKMTDVSRRALRVAVADLQWTQESSTVRLQFGLPSGAFATAVLREVFAYSDATVAVRSDVT